MVRAGPVVGLERKPDLDVEVLARPAPDLLLAGDLRRLEVLDQPRDRHRAVAVGRDHRPVRRVAPSAGLDDLVRELVQHRQHRSVGAAVSDGARLHQLVAEDSRRRVVRLRRDEDQKAFRLRNQPATQLPDDLVGLIDLSDLMQLVDQHAGRLRTGGDAGVEGLDFEPRFRAPVGDGLQMLLDVQPLLQEAIRVALDHPRGLVEREFRDLVGRAGQQEFRARPAVHQQRRHHQGGAVGGLAVLLRD